MAIAIIDYGMGNIHSVQNALQVSGARTVVTSKPEEIKKAERIVLPGVGAFCDAMKELERRGLVQALKDAIKEKKPFLGICLGMQLLFETSEEAKGIKGLGFLKGSVKRFPERKGLKVPHMGWNQLRVRRSGCDLLKAIAESEYVYFCHSYYPEPKDKEATAASSEYGEDFTSVVWQENIYGAQFHPEKSQETGIRMLKNFITLC